MGTGPGDVQGGAARPVHTEVAWGPDLLPSAAGVDIALDLESVRQSQPCQAPGVSCLFEDLPSSPRDLVHPLPPNSIGSAFTAILGLALPCWSVGQDVPRAWWNMVPQFPLA